MDSLIDMSLVLENSRIIVLKTNTVEFGDSVVGVYSDDEDGRKTLERVQRNMARKGFETKTEVHMVNIPNQ